MTCWQDSRWDFKPARFFSQLRLMRASATGLVDPLQHFGVQSGLGCWQQWRYDFHLVPTYTTRSLLHYKLHGIGHSTFIKLNEGTGCSRDPLPNHKRISDLSQNFKNNPDLSQNLKIDQNYEG